MALQLPTSLSEVVRLARGQRAQKDFASELGIKQPQLSRYENGRQEPPAEVLNKCLKLISGRISGALVPSAEELAERIRMELAGTKKTVARGLVQSLLDTFGKRSPGRPTVETVERSSRRKRSV